MTDIVKPNSDTQIAPAEGRFPTAQAPGATTLAEVLETWRARGLQPVEITEGEQLQRIIITHDPLRGELKWETQGPMDGLIATEVATNAMLLMPAILVAEGAFSIAEYFTRGPGKLDLGTGQAGVVVGFKDGRLSLAYDPPDAPIAAKKLLAAALLFMVTRDAGLPLEKLLSAFS